MKDIKYSKSYSTQEIHFTGGLRGSLTNRGWALFPASEDPDSDALVFETPEAHYIFATRECGLRHIGTCIHYRNGDNSPPMSVWEPGKRDPSNGLNAADSWRAIAHQATVAGDNLYSECATYISVCLKVSGLRLRDVSNKYRDQLNWALAERRESGAWFSNIALLDLYADFHSLVSELSSARDHLAKLAAIHAGAPDRIDSLARLEDWLEKPANLVCVNQPLITLLLSASGTAEKPNWLRRLGALRNEMLHRIPMGANKSVSGLILQDVSTSQGTIKTIRLAEPPSNNAVAKQDPDSLIEFSQLCTNLEHLCRTAQRIAKYPAEIPRFTNSTTS
ncbi:hypothetical protein [Uliginosibacterium flavum]|uniref:Apea-like HEPN domain-containing protein n=1 Tax=Uliginosibacterium flavum TaxID=1396831 RepID=A0ABV2TR17_9RHOO